MKSAMADDLRPRYADHEEFLENISLLDPRFKTTCLSEEKVLMVPARVTAAAAAMGPTPVKQEPGTNTHNAATNQQEPLPELPQLDIPTVPEGKKPLGGLASILEDVVITKTERATKSKLEQLQEEKKVYLATDALPLRADPLLWWKEEAWRFPHLALLARKLLCIPATSVPSERVFSSAGDIVSAQRATLGSDKVDMLLFLKKKM